jgi:GDP-4-dehydro-6-deoxy-D-mannose reductase
VKALITGAGGFVGPHLAAHLADEGDDVIGVDSADGPDLRNADGWFDLLTDVAPDVIYHLAGRSDVGASWNEPITTFEVNALGTVSVLDAARRAGVGRVVVVSSADVYGTVGPDALPLTEDQPACPRSPYGASKQAAEAAAVQYWRGHRLETVVARPFNHLGPGQRTSFIAASFANQIARAEAEGGGTLLHGDLTPQRDMTDVRDVVRAYRLLAVDGQPGEIYNVCSGRSISMEQLLESLLALTDGSVDRQVDQALLRPVDLPALRGSFDKLAAATGWRPLIDLETTLAAVLDDARLRQRLALAEP